jgi:hypothetical protein
MLGSRSAVDAPKQAHGVSQSAQLQAPEPPAVQPWRDVKAHATKLTFALRADPDLAISSQPWTNALTDSVLAAARDGSISLALVWPVRLDTIVPLHALANLERNMATDLCGLRTLFFPGNHTSAAPLQSFLVSRFPLTDMYRRLWVEKDGLTVKHSATESESFAALLAALNDIRSHTPDVPNPSIAETTPTFVFADGSWKTTASKPLERSLRKVRKLAHRRKIRDDINSNWSNPANAPGALMVVHGNTKRAGWKVAFNALCAPGVIRPSVMLFDATWVSQRSNPVASSRIVEFFKSARESGLESAGAVIVTDDPKTYFILRARLRDMGVRFSAETYAAEAEQVLLSPHPLPIGWAPEQRSNANFVVGIVDRDAASVAVAFNRLAHAAGTEESVGNKALTDAFLYILRLSNMPAGFIDLMDAASAGEIDTYSLERNSWPTIELAVNAAVDVGAVGGLGKEIADALGRARKLIQAWTDATPMAARLLSVIERQVQNPKSLLCIVLPNQRYIRLAHRYLQRKLGDRWSDVESQLEWHTLVSAGKNLSGDKRECSFVFVGANADVLRILLAHPHLPHGTTILIAYRQAESLLTTLNSMKEVDALKAYRGRIGLLAQEIERRMGELTHPIPNLKRLGDLSFTLKFDESTSVDPANEQSYYRFDLEGGRHTFCSGWVYRYEPDEDPFFRRTAVSNVEVGTLIFDMTDELRRKVEEALHVNGGALGSVVHPERTFLKLYHLDVQKRCAALYVETNRTALAGAIHRRMLELDPTVSDCPAERLTYWLQLTAEDNRPHASKNQKYFKVFCSALDMPEHQAANYWAFVKNARRLAQNLGRVLAAQYAEILFQPESAVAYRNIALDAVKKLQQEAIRCVSRVEKIHAPQVLPSQRKSA